MKYLLLMCICLPFTFAASGQESYNVTDFSDTYAAKVLVGENPEIVVYSKRTGKELVRQTVELDAESIEYYKEEANEIQSNVCERPYGMQSMLIYDDFNFDGRKDLALLEGHFSCYGGPSFRIYLASAKSGFAYSEEFSELAQNYCGMFSYDASEKRIYTMTKSGCCWHQYSEFMVENGKPVPVKIIEE